MCPSSLADSVLVPVLGAGVMPCIVLYGCKIGKFGIVIVLLRLVTAVCLIVRSYI